ncbi:hypothetical protein D3C76_1656380 [compost metagenome]
MAWAWTRKRSSGRKAMKIIKAARPLARISSSAPCHGRAGNSSRLNANTAASARVTPPHSCQANPTTGKRCHQRLRPLRSWA